MTYPYGNRKRKPQRFTRWPLLSVIFVCGLMLMAVGWWFTLPAREAAPASLSNEHLEMPALAHSGLNLSAITTSSPVPPAYQSATKGVVQKYMAAFLSQRYAAMWSLLQPDMQAQWPDEAGFARFWQARFQGYTLQHFSIGGATRWLPAWVNPETMKTYHDVLVVPVSLSLQPDAAIAHDPLAPPEDVNPTALYQNMPFIVQPVLDKNNRIASLHVLDGGPADPEAPILPPVHPTFAEVEVPIMMYHHVSNVIPTDLLGISLTVKNTKFQQQLAYLQQKNYHSITFNQLFDALYFGGPLPVHPIILTFDDGYNDVYTFAYPLLKQYGFTGTFNIISGKVNWAGYLKWDQIRQMMAGGMQIASHTVYHYSLGALLAYSKAEAQYELQQSKATLQQQLGITIQQFCYPSGSPFRGGTLAQQQEITTMLAAGGYVGATTDPGETGVYQSSLRPFALLRVRVDGRETLQSFEYSLPW